MQLTGKWTVGGRSAGALELIAAMLLARAHRARQRQGDREGSDLDRQANAVGRAIRKSQRARERMAFGCKPAPVSGRRNGGVKLRRFEKLLGLHSGGRSTSRRDGPSSFHFKLTPRGRGNRSRPYLRGEVVRAVRYILRDSAREIQDSGIVSNIADDPDRIASVFQALEELELVAGRDNANVYNSLVISLPAELDGDRESLLVAICAPLRDMGVPFVAVLHAPDPRGDERNYHAHVLFSWRPFKPAEDEVRFSDLTVGAENGPDFIKDLRRHAAREMNHAMQARGHARRFTAEKIERSDPTAPAKRTAGQTHHLRRAAAIEAAVEERRALTGRLVVLDRLADAARAWSFAGGSGRQGVIDRLMARFADLYRASLQKPSAEERPSGISVEIVSPAPVSREKQAASIVPPRQQPFGKIAAEEPAPAPSAPKTDIGESTQGEPAGGYSPETANPPTASSTDEQSAPSLSKASTRRDTNAGTPAAVAATKRLKVAPVSKLTPPAPAPASAPAPVRANDDDDRGRAPAADATGSAPVAAEDAPSSTSTEPVSSTSAEPNRRPSDMIRDAVRRRQRVTLPPSDANEPDTKAKEPGPPQLDIVQPRVEANRSQDRDVVVRRVQTTVTVQDLFERWLHSDGAKASPRQRELAEAVTGHIDRDQAAILRRDGDIRVWFTHDTIRPRLAELFAGAGGRAYAALFADARLPPPRWAIGPGTSLAQLTGDDGVGQSPQRQPRRGR